MATHLPGQADDTAGAMRPGPSRLGIIAYVAACIGFFVLMAVLGIVVYQYVTRPETPPTSDAQPALPRDLQIGGGGSNSGATQ